MKSVLYAKQPRNQPGNNSSGIVTDIQVLLRANCNLNGNSNIKCNKKQKPQ